MAHLDDLALNAHLDGDADHGDHLDGCAPCQGRLSELRAVAVAIGEMPQPLGTSEADRLIAGALGSAQAGEADSGASITSLADRRARRASWLAAAAVVLLLVAAVPVILSGRGNDGGDAAAPASRQELAEDSAGAGSATEGGSTGDLTAGAAAGGLAATGGTVAGGPISDGDLGPRSDIAELERAARARLDTPSGGDETEPPVVARCEGDARAALGTSGAFVYVATVRWKGSDAEVLVFREDDGSRPLAVMARPSCRLLDRGQT